MTDLSAYEYASDVLGDEPDPDAVCKPQNDLKGYLTVVIFLFMAISVVQPKTKIFRIMTLMGRPYCCLLSAAFTVLIGQVGGDEAFASVDLTILGLLFGMMLLSQLCDVTHMADMFHDVLMYNNPSGYSLITRISIMTFLIATVITNDGAVVFMAPLVYQITTKNPKFSPPWIFLIAVATQSNIGSAIFLTGNPQNLLVRQYAAQNISFNIYFTGVVIPTFIAFALNLLICWVCYYWVAPPVVLRVSNPDLQTMNVQLLDEEAALQAGDNSYRNLDHLLYDDESSTNSSPEDEKVARFASQEPSIIVRSPSNSHSQTSSTRSQADRPFRGNTLPELSTSAKQNNNSRSGKRRRGSGDEQGLSGEGVLHTGPSFATFQNSMSTSLSSKNEAFAHWFIKGRHASDGHHKVFAVLFLITLCIMMGIFFFTEATAAWVALTCGLAMTALYTIIFNKPARTVWSRVEPDVYLIFAGLFITTQGVVDTCYTQYLWNLATGSKEEDGFNPYNPYDLVLFIIAVLAFSNTVGNVATVVLLNHEMQTAKETTTAWLLLAWISTIAGNLTLLGSAANIITAETVKPGAPNAHYMTFSRHLPIGVASTLINIVVCVPIILWWMA